MGIPLRCISASDPHRQVCERSIKMNRISKIVTKYRPRLNQVANGFYFFDRIPLDRLQNAQLSYADLEAGETPFLLFDWAKKGKKGYVITDRGLYARWFHPDEPRRFKWCEIETLYFDYSNIYINSRVFLDNDRWELNDFYWLPFCMIHEIYRSMFGQSIRVNFHKSLSFPNKCIGCFGKPNTNKLQVTIFGPREPDWIKKHSSKLGIPGILVGVILGDWNRPTLREDSLPICEKCWSQLTKWEQQLYPGLGWPDSRKPNFINSFVTNRYLSIELLNNTIEI